MVTKSIKDPIKRAKLHINMSKAQIDQHLKELSYLEKFLEELKDEEMKSRYTEELNSQYKNEISLVKKRINLINKDMVERRKLIKESEDYLENSKQVSTD